MRESKPRLEMVRGSTAFLSAFSLQSNQGERGMPPSMHTEPVRSRQMQFRLRVKFCMKLDPSQNQSGFRSENQRPVNDRNWRPRRRQARLAGCYLSVLMARCEKGLLDADLAGGAGGLLGGSAPAFFFAMAKRAWRVRFTRGTYHHGLQTRLIVNWSDISTPSWKWLR